MSIQQSKYLELRADGASVILASVKSNLPIGEAHLLEKAIANGTFEDAIPVAFPGSGAAAAQQQEPVMAKTPERGTNLTETKEVIRNAVPEIINLKAKRKELNEEIAAIRERVNAAGIPKHALDHAIRVREMDPEDRERFDEGVAIVRDVIGAAMSRSLFDYLDTPAGGNGEEPPPPPVNASETTMVQ